MTIWDFVAIEVTGAAYGCPYMWWRMNRKARTEAERQERQERLEAYAWAVPGGTLTLIAIPGVLAWPVLLALGLRDAAAPTYAQIRRVSGRN